MTHFVYWKYTAHVLNVHGLFTKNMPSLEINYMYTVCKSTDETEEYGSLIEIKLIDFRLAFSIVAFPSTFDKIEHMLWVFHFHIIVYISQGIIEDVDESVCSLKIDK